MSFADDPIRPLHPPPHVLEPSCAINVRMASKGVLHQPLKYTAPFLGGLIPLAKQPKEATPSEIAYIN